MEHTQGKWHVGQGNGEGSIFADNGRMRLEAEGTCLYPICKVIDFNGEAKANAEFIVRACNAHDELVDACNLILERIDLGRVVARGENRVKSYEIKGKRNEDIRDIIKTFKQALAKAKGKGV